MSKEISEQYRKIEIALERYKHQERLDRFFSMALKSGAYKVRYRANDWEAIKAELAVLRQIAVDHYQLLKKVKKNDN